MGGKNCCLGLFFHIWTMILQDHLDRRAERERYSNHCVWKSQCCQYCFDGEFAHLAGRRILIGASAWWRQFGWVEPHCEVRCRPSRRSSSTTSSWTPHWTIRQTTRCWYVLHLRFSLFWLIFRCSCCRIFSKRIFPIRSYSYTCYRNG